MMRNKTPGADLEKKRGLFFQIGLTIALATAILVINYETPKPVKDDTTTVISGLELTVIGGQNVDSSKLTPPPAAPDKKMQKK